MNKEILNIINVMYDEYGKDLFCDSLKLNTYMHDLLAQYPNERKRMSIAVSEGIVKKMVEESNRNETCNRYVYVDVLHSSYGMEHALAEEIIDIFSTVIFNKKKTDNLANTVASIAEDKDEWARKELIRQQIVLSDMMFINGEREIAYKQYLEVADSHNNSSAQWRVAKCLYHGWGVELNKEIAKEYFRKSAEQGYADAKYFIITHDYINEPEKMVDALETLIKENDHPGAYYTLGDLYAKGKGCTQNYQLAFEMTKKAAEKNHCYAMSVLSSMYLMGVGVPHSDNKSKEWEEKSKLVSRYTDSIFIEKIKKESKL